MYRGGGGARRGKGLTGWRGRQVRTTLKELCTNVSSRSNTTHFLPWMTKARQGKARGGQCQQFVSRKHRAAEGGRENDWR